MSEARVLVIGDIMHDIIVKPDGPIARGSDVHAQIAQHLGGSGANQAAWLAFLGVPTRFVARIGAADAGWANERLGRWITDLRLSIDDDCSSGRLITLLDPDGERSFLTDRGANDKLCPADLSPSLLDGVAVLHVSGYCLFAEGPRNAVLALVAEARRCGIAVSLDPASAGFLKQAGPARFLEWVSGADFLFPNADEAATLTGCTDPEAQSRELARHFECVVIKRGAEGAQATRGGRTWTVPAPAASVVDTSGAGDAFLAGYLSAHLEGNEIEACLECGAWLGAQAVSIAGGQPSEAIARTPAA